jgi:GrpB-like predicted nucleotidyltransferase (UPF0157 family)
VGAGQDSRIRIVRYDPKWTEAFEHEARALRSAFGASAHRIEHVGSTSVPNLDAKPVIDIQISVASLADLTEFTAALEQLGYARIPMGDFDLVYPFFQRPPTWPSTHHVHLCEVGGEQERRHLAFRDYLRDHADVAADYVRLKRRLAAKSEDTTLESRERYSLAKSDFVEEVLLNAYREGYPR